MGKPNRGCHVSSTAVDTQTRHLSAPYLSLNISAKSLRVSCFATLVHQPRLYVAFDINDILGLATSFDDDS